MVCQNKYSPKACKHDYQHVAPLDEEWIHAPCTLCGNNAPAGPQPEEEGEGEGEGVAEMWVSLSSYAVVCGGECRSVHTESTGEYLYMNRTDGMLYCTACKDVIVDADGTFWYVSSILTQRVMDDEARNIVVEDLVLEEEAEAAKGASGEAGGEGGGSGESGGKGESGGGEAEGGSGADEGDSKVALVGSGEAIFMSGWTAMHDAAKAGKLSEVRQELNESPEFIHGIHEADGWTPLHFAAYGGHTEIARALVEAGSPINYQCARFGWTPLHAAVLSEASEVAEILIAAGSDTTLLNNEGVSPIDLCPDDVSKASLLSFAASVLGDSES